MDAGDRINGIKLRDTPERGVPFSADDDEQGGAERIKPAKLVTEFHRLSFLAFNTSTAFSPTDVPALADGLKSLMMLQSLLSLLIIALLSRARRQHSVIAAGGASHASCHLLFPLTYVVTLPYFVNNKFSPSSSEHPKISLLLRSTYAIQKGHKTYSIPRALGATSDAAILSQAAVLLLMEPELRRNRVLLSEYQSARRTLRVPAISATSRRVKVEEVESPLRLRPLSWAREVIPVGRFRRLASDLAKKKNRMTAASLMEACLRHPHPLVRAAAALSYFGLTSEPSRLIGILEDCTQSDDDLVRHVAATGLARLAPESPRLAELSKDDSGERWPPSSHVAAGSRYVGGKRAVVEAWWKFSFLLIERHSSRPVCQCRCFFVVRDLQRGGPRHRRYGASGLARWAHHSKSLLINP